MKKLKNVKLFESSGVYNQVLCFFFSFPAQAIGLNDLSESVSVSKTAVKKVVNVLVQEGFLKKEVVGNAWRLSADQQHPFMFTRKIPYNLQLIYESGIVSVVYDRVPSAKSILLFGSYRWGTDNEKSDIDIAVEILDGNDLRIENLGVIERLGLRKNVKVNIHIFSRNRIDLNLFTNIANGILLDGLLEVHP